jgi:protein SCO1/2
MMHTDRISLIDKNGILRKNYKGSTINIEEIVSDIKTLRD